MQGVKQDFAALTTLRAIGALCVVEHHCWLFVYPAWPRSWIVPGFQLWPDYFFILSGFILTHVYGKTLRHGGRDEVFNYFVHRIARVYPLHLAVLVMLVGLESIRLLMAQHAGLETRGRYFVDSTSPRYILTNLLLVQAWGIQHMNSWNMPAWSISAEFACYLAFPMMLNHELASKPRRAALLATISACGLTWIQLSRHTFDVTFDLGVPRAFFSFSIGCVLYHYRHVLLNAVAFIPATALQSSIVAGVLAAYAVNAPGLAFIPLWVALIAAMTRENGLPAKILAWPPLVAMGERSYSYYMTHVLVIWAMLLTKAAAPATFGQFLEWPSLAILAAILGTTIGISEWTYRYIEKPGRAWVRRRLSRHQICKTRQWDDVANPTGAHESLAKTAR
ncbi:MAG: acyltransferase [Nevskiaceae bacterium]|nr:MAG: acyltransferase [Nevskiaceae bacterium]